MSLDYDGLNQNDSSNHSLFLYGKNRSIGHYIKRLTNALLVYCEVADGCHDSDQES